MSSETSTKKHEVVGIPEPTIRRLPAYLRYLKELDEDGTANVSGRLMSRELDVDPTQLNKDLAYTGVSGRPKVGYTVVEVINAIEELLDFKKDNEAFLVGAGLLGSTLIGYEGFRDIGLKIIAAFDNDTQKIGTEINGVPVLSVSKFRNLADRMHVQIGVITTPADQAQNIADLMVAWGIKAIWNFTPINIKVPKKIIIQNTSIYENLAVILNKLKVLNS